MRELQEGYRPDVLIFYDGVNDTTSALLSGEAGLSTNEINRRQEFNLLQSPRRLTAVLAEKLVLDSGSYRLARAIRSRLLGQTSGPSSNLSDEKTRRLAGDVVDRYVANVKLVETLARGYGFRPLFFWQPTIFNKTHLTAAERDEAREFAWTEPAFRMVYERVSESSELKANPDFHDLSKVFDDETELVFIDYCHTTEAASARIADRMAAAVLSLQE